mmetsp:Transcript_95913/g.286300  ORF Transcript_95913/g.286300 Transcript_95913/m.286300 type:complete len:204 (+) Transcript_95913:324-935(+)
MQCPRSSSSSWPAHTSGSSEGRTVWATRPAAGRQPRRRTCASRGLAGPRVEIRLLKKQCLAASQGSGRGLLRPTSSRRSHARDGDAAASPSRRQRKSTSSAKTCLRTSGQTRCLKTVPAASQPLLRSASLRWKRLIQPCRHPLRRVQCRTFKPGSARVQSAHGPALLRLQEAHRHPPTAARVTRGAARQSHQVVIPWRVSGRC